MKLPLLTVATNAAHLRPELAEYLVRVIALQENILLRVVPAHVRYDEAGRGAPAAYDASSIPDEEPVKRMASGLPAASITFWSMRTILRGFKKSVSSTCALMTASARFAAAGGDLGGREEPYLFAEEAREAESVEVPLLEDDRASPPRRPVRSSLVHPLLLQDAEQLLAHAVELSP